MLTTILKTSLLTLLLVTSGCTEKQENPLQSVDSPSFSKLIEKYPNVVILDVRTPQEWANGIIPNAIKINLFDTEFNKKTSLLDKENPVLIYCKSGGRSSRAQKKLYDKGFKKVINLAHGFDGWKAAGFPIQN